MSADIWVVVRKMSRRLVFRGNPRSGTSENPQVQWTSGFWVPTAVTPEIPENQALTADLQMSRHLVLLSVNVQTCGFFVRYMSADIWIVGSVKVQTCGPKQLEDAPKQLEDASKQLEDSAKQLEADAKQLEDDPKQLEDGPRQLEDSPKQLDYDVMIG